MALGPRRILLTGVANFWGRRLAQRLLADPAVERVVGVDVRAPGIAHERLELVEADLRDPGVPALLGGLDVDAVVHNDILQFAEPGRSARQLHDINVIGTLQLLAACERIPSLRALVVRGSAAIYGSEPAAPQFFTEDMAGRYPLRTRFQRDIGELENLFGTFARRRADVACTMLRFQPVIGATLDTPITRLLRLPVVPTYLGFDPRMQFVHEDDSVDALAAAVRHPVAGAVNVAGPGTISLTRMLRIFRKPSIPIVHPLFGPVVGAAARLGPVEVSPDVARFLRYGRGVDTRRLTEEVGFTPRHTTVEAVEAVAAELRGSTVAARAGAAG